MENSEIEKRKLTLDDLAHKEGDVEFWFAREIMSIMGYAQWRRFEEAVKRAMVSAETNETPVQHHFASAGKMVELGGGSKREVKDYKLTRYACYLIAMNGDPHKEEIAFAQAYFAVQTREREVIDERMAAISRIAARDGLTEAEKLFSANMYERGVDERGIGRVRSKGDAALFGGKTTKQMKEHYGLKGNKPLADHLPRVTLAAKQLATELTNHNVEEHDMRGEQPITEEHVQNNRDVRDLLGKRGVVPEELPPEEDVKKLKRRVKADERKLKTEAQTFAPFQEGLKLRHRAR